MVTTTRMFWEPCPNRRGYERLVRERFEGGRMVSWLVVREVQS